VINVPFVAITHAQPFRRTRPGKIENIGFEEEAPPLSDDDRLAERAISPMTLRHSSVEVLQNRSPPAGPAMDAGEGCRLRVTSHATISNSKGPTVEGDLCLWKNP